MSIPAFIQSVGFLQRSMMPFPSSLATIFLASSCYASGTHLAIMVCLGQEFSVKKIFIFGAVMDLPGTSKFDNMFKNCSCIFSILPTCAFVTPLQLPFRDCAPI
jgi:hypothetical protein